MKSGKSESSFENKVDNPSAKSLMFCPSIIYRLGSDLLGIHLNRLLLVTENLPENTNLSICLYVLQHLEVTILSGKP